MTAQNNVLALVKEKIIINYYKVKSVRTHAMALYPMVFALINVIYYTHIYKTLTNALNNVLKRMMEKYITMKVCIAPHNVHLIMWKIK